MASYQRGGFKADVPNWLIFAVIGGAGLYVVNKVRNIGAGVKDAAAKTGEAISGKVFDVLHPELRAENYNKPTIIDLANGNANSKCPSGYKLTYGKVRGWYCLRVN